MRWEKRKNYRFSLVCPKFCQFSASMNKLSFGDEYKNFAEFYCWLRSRTYIDLLFTWEEIFPVLAAVGTERVSQYQQNPGHIKNVDECWCAIRIHARTRNVSRKFRIFEEEKMVPGTGGGELTSIRDLARTANWFVIQVAWRFARRSGSTLFIPYPGREEWSKLEGKGASEVGRRCREKAAACGSKKERDVSLTRDLLRTINCGGAEIIRDFVAVTCDANKSFVPITYALKLPESANTYLSEDAHLFDSTKGEIVKSIQSRDSMIAVCPSKHANACE